MCKRCICARVNKPCLSCLPHRAGRCLNRLSRRQEETRCLSAHSQLSSVTSAAADEEEPPNATVKPATPTLLLTTHAAADGKEPPRATSTDSSKQTNNASDTEGGRSLQDGATNGPENLMYGRLPSYVSDNLDNGELVNDSCERLTDAEVITLMKNAFGESLIKSDGRVHHSLWYLRWKKVVQLTRRHYMLPGGSVGRIHVDTLANDLVM